MIATITPESLRALAGRWPEYPNELRDALRAAADEIETKADKIEGLTCDLRMAVETAYKRGATWWTEMNYPKWFAEFEAAKGATVIQAALSEKPE